MKRIAIILLLGLISCELVVDIDIPIEKRKIVLNSSFTTDSLWTANVSLSRHILDDGPYKYLDDASVVIYEEGNPIDTLSNKGSGTFQSNSKKPIIEKEYEIRVESTKYGSVNSKSSTPAPINIKRVDFSISETIPQNFTGNERAVINIQFEDPARELNYYEVTIFGERKYFNPYEGDTIYHRYPLMVYSNDPIFSDGYERTDNALVFNDLFFDGKEKSLEVRIDYYYHFPDSKLFLHFKTLSYDLYRYKMTTGLQNHVSNDPFAQPVKVYNNIDNGFGIFGGYSGYLYEYKK